jgi:hypothetical protein
LQSIGCVFGPSKSRPARGTSPFGEVRNQRRLSDPPMRSFVTKSSECI